MVSTAHINSALFDIRLSLHCLTSIVLYSSLAELYSIGHLCIRWVGMVLGRHGTSCY